MLQDNDDFNFFLKFCMPLVLNLARIKDRTIAARWLQKLREMHAADPENNIYTEYLKLLLFVMQQDKLRGIFQTLPPDGPLQIFPGLDTAIDMAVLMKPLRTELPLLPPIHMSYSGDVCEFIAIQEIPDFGLHGYYALSTDPLPILIQPRIGLLKTDKYKNTNDSQLGGLKSLSSKPKTNQNTQHRIRMEYKKEK